MKYDLVTDWENKNILLVGLGQTGLSCVQFLHKHGLSFSVVDSRQQPAGLKELQKIMPDVSVTTGKFSQKQFIAADILIVSPGVSVNEPAIQAAKATGTIITGDVDMFCQLAEKQIIAITGSNGKSTVTQLVGDAINATTKSALVGGNIGIPVLELLQQPEPDFYVLELSSFQLETITHLKNHVACILNISEDHMDRYESYYNYISTKANILDNASQIIASIDDENVYGLLNAIATENITRISASDKTASYYLTNDNDVITLHGKGDRIIAAESLNLTGKHNYTNVLFVFAILQLLEIDISEAIDTVKHFSGLKHRCQTVLTHNNIDWINDSKATNVAATLAAINGLSDTPIILLLGGQAKGQDFEPLSSAIAADVKLLIVYGQDANKITADINVSDKTVVVSDLEQAVKKAAKNAQSGYRVLLSPACASFDQFKNFEQRGDIFAKLAQQYGGAK